MLDRAHEAWLAERRRRWRWLHAAWSWYMGAEVARWPRDCDFGNADTLVAVVRDLWEAFMIEYAHVIRVDYASAQCSDVCFVERSTAQLFTGRPRHDAELVELFGCWQHGTFHRCTEWHVDCHDRVTDEHGTSVCAFSGRVLGVAMHDTEGNASDGDLAYRYGMARSIDVLQAGSLRYERRSAPRAPPEVPVAAQGSDGAAKTKTSVSDAIHHWKTVNFIGRHMQQTARRLAASTCASVVQRIMMDQAIRDQISTAAMHASAAKARTALVNYYSDCMRQERLPVLVDTVALVSGAQAFVMSGAAVSDVELREVLVSRVLSLWHCCHASPHAAGNRSVPLTHVCVAALMCMADGLYVDAPGHFQRHCIVPVDERVRMHMPPRVHLDHFAEPVTGKAPRESFRSQQAACGTVVHFADVVPEHMREPALTGGTGVLHFKTSDVDRAVEWIQACAMSYGATLSQVRWYDAQDTLLGHDR